jgi:hypothetical protein
MSDDEVFQIDEPASPRRFSIGDAWSWLFPVAAFALFESFANPGIAVAVACLKFGYPDFRTALWLTSDRNVCRGIVLPPCYVARGCFVSAFLSVLAVAVIGVFEQAILKNVPFAVFEDLLIATALMNFVGIGLGVVTLVFGVHKAVSLNVRVWMDPTIHEARRERRWWSVCRGRFNGFRGLCLLTCLVGLLLLIGAFAAGAATWNNLVQSGMGERVSVTLLTWAIIGVPALYIVWLSNKAWRLAARTPDDCWG